MNQSRTSQSGMTLIEVMVSVLIFTLGVLGLVAVQARASQLVSDSEDRNRAALLGNEAIALLWQYIPFETAPAALPGAVYTTWQNEVNKQVNGTAGTSSGLLGLPNGVGTITSTTSVNADGTLSVLYLISIQWQEPSVTTVNRYVTQVTFP